MAPQPAGGNVCRGAIQPVAVSRLTSHPQEENVVVSSSSVQPVVVVSKLPSGNNQSCLKKV